MVKDHIHVTMVKEYRGGITWATGGVVAREVPQLTQAYPGTLRSRANSSVSVSITRRNGFWASAG